MNCFKQRKSTDQSKLLTDRIGDLYSHLFNRKNTLGTHNLAKGRE